MSSRHQHFRRANALGMQSECDELFGHDGVTWLPTSPPLKAIARLIAMPLPSVPGIIAFGLGVIASMYGVVAFSLAVIALPIAFNGGACVQSHRYQYIHYLVYCIRHCIYCLGSLIIVFTAYFIAFQFTLDRMVAQINIFIHYI